MTAPTAERCPTCDREGCPTLAIVRPSYRTLHTSNWFALSEDDRVAVQAYQSKRIPAEADCALHAVDWRARSIADRAAKDEAERHLGNLLAIILRDGGQHEAAVGTVQAVADARERYCALVEIVAAVADAPCINSGQGPCATGAGCLPHRARELLAPTKEKP